MRLFQCLMTPNIHLPVTLKNPFTTPLLELSSESIADGQQT